MTFEYKICDTRNNNKGNLNYNKDVQFHMTPVVENKNKKLKYRRFNVIQISLCVTYRGQ